MQIPPGNHGDWLFPVAHNKVALHQSDTLMDLEKDPLAGNNGDAGDPYPGVFANSEFSPGSTPNSGSYGSSDSRVGVYGISEVSGDITADIYTYPVGADWDGDLQADIFWRRNDTGENYVWYMDGAVATGGASVPGADPAWKIEE